MQDQSVLARPRAADTVVMTLDGHEERRHADIHPASTPTRITTAELTPDRDIHAGTLPSCCCGSWRPA